MMTIMDIWHVETESFLAQQRFQLHESVMYCLSPFHNLSAPFDNIKRTSENEARSLLSDLENLS